MAELTSDQDITRLLKEVRTIAVIGAHPKPSRPASYVPSYLAGQGYRILPINATKVGKIIEGVATVATLGELTEPVDLVDVFRRSEDVPGHLAEILALDPLPKAVWLQLGIRNEAVAERLIKAGIEVVQDRCTLAEHRRLGVGPVSGG